MSSAVAALPDVQVKVAGHWLDELADVTDVEWSTRWQRQGPSGCWDASWKLALSPDLTVPWLLFNAVVELWDGATRIWVGRANEPVKSRDGWDCSARGLAVLAGEYDAIDAAENPTTKPLTAVTEAVADGLPWEPQGGDWATILTDVAQSAQDTDQVSTVADVLDALVEKSGRKRWAIFGDGLFRIGTDPTTVSWYSDVAITTAAEDEFVSVLRLRYVRDQVAPTPDTIETVKVSNAARLARWGHRTRPVDRTGLGPMSLADATTLANNILDDVGPRMGWGAALDLTPYDLTTPGGLGPVRTSLVDAGQLLRAPTVGDHQGALSPELYADLVGTEVKHKADGTITFAPLGLAPRGFAKALEDLAASGEDAGLGLTG